MNRNLQISASNYDTSIISNNIGSDTEFILWGRSFIYIMNSKGPRTDPGGTPCYSVPQSEKNVGLY